MVGNKDMRSWFGIVVGAVIVVLATMAWQPGSAQQSSEFCSTAQAKCSAMMNSSCMSSYGAGAKEADLSSSCKSQLDSYRGCLRTLADLCSTTGSVTTPPPVRDYSASCSARHDECLSDIEDNFDACYRATSNTSCRADCRSARRTAESSCSRNQTSCQRNGSFSSVNFRDPPCLDDEDEPQPGLSTIPSTQPYTGSTPAYGAVCRLGIYYCVMVVPSVLGGQCSCPYHPAGPFAGIVMNN